MNPPTVLLEDSFLAALTTPTDERHAVAAGLYRELVTEFRAERLLLVALASSIRQLDRELRTTLLAPVASLHLGGRARNAASRMVAEQKAADIFGEPLDLPLATTLVAMRREQIDRVATFDQRLAHVAFDVVLLRPDDDPDQSSAA
jgi:predicted nucleic acid-binding protein